jgi:ribosomal protein S18 acetylase RimI-like enzyme
MSSMYGLYLKEKTDDLIKETEQGFATYRYLDDSKTVYIIDLYVHPDFRQTNIASTIADNIVEEAKAKGCIKLLGSVVPSNKNSTVSLKVLLAYGMSLESSSNDFIVFKKGI